MKWYHTVSAAGAALLVMACADRPSTGPDKAGPNLVVAGAGFTTTNPAYDNPTDDPLIELCLNGPGIINCNLYGAKEFVWINGGPAANGLTDGSYFFAVLAPGGQPDPNDLGAGNLSDDVDTYLNRRFIVSGGEISSYVPDDDGNDDPGDTEDHVFANGLIRLFDYADTPNPGGVYIMAICQISTDPAILTLGAPVTPSSCKYDAFKARVGDNPPPPEFGRISGLKYYDTNRNGKYDDGEEGIADWPIDYLDGIGGTLFTGNDGTFSEQFDADQYTFTEQQANAPWVQTGNIDAYNQASPLAKVSLSSFVYTVDLADGDNITGINFGNVCEVYNRNGNTLGYWSNSNGKAVLAGDDPDWRSLLNSHNLMQPNGGGGAVKNFDIDLGKAFETIDKKKVASGAYPDFRTWLLGADASKTNNMAYMLSAQLAATVLNIEYKGLDDDALVVDPVSGDWKSISFIIGAADAALASQLTNTPASRTLLEKYKIIFDRLNNNIQVITPSTQAGCPDPTFPS